MEKCSQIWAVPEETWKSNLSEQSTCFESIHTLQYIRKMTVILHKVTNPFDSVQNFLAVLVNMEGIDACHMSNTMKTQEEMDATPWTFLSSAKVLGFT